MVAKKPKNKQLKLEYSIKVMPKNVAKLSKPIAAKKTKPNKKHTLLWSKIPKHKRPLYLFESICGMIILFSIFSVANSLRQTNSALDRAARVADSLNTTDATATRNAKIIGSNDQLTKEIDNYASSPADLQSYVLKDYRLLKQKCIVNGSIYGSLSYSIASVADAQFAQIKRNCNGAQTQILKKFDEKWTVVHEGNDPPLCSLVNDLAIPQRVSLNCVIGGTMYLNPNP